MMVADMSSSGRSDKDEESMEPMRVAHAYDDDAQRCTENMVDKRWGGFVLLLAALTGILSLLPNHRTPGPQIVEYQCPATVGKAVNDEADHFTKDYLSAEGGASNVVGMNITAFLENDNFKKSDYDNWGRTYEQVKKGMYHWKSTMYPDELNEGDSIYESACGIGLNLYMTLEILNEMKSLESLVVYGNEYLEESAVKANALFDRAAPFRSTKGRICQGDSTHLGHVPSNSFGLVFTGYITPIYDPIKVENGTINENYKLYKHFCEGTDWKDQKLANLTQEKQQDFYAAWVGEMIRIAKPGKAVIVEQVSMPYCDEYRDWGGVRREWWEPAIEHYEWNVDPKSIVMEKDSLFMNRYHVFMRKNP